MQDRRGDLDSPPDGTRWDDRAILGSGRGIPWWGGVVLTVALAGVGAVANLMVATSLGRLFQGAYLLGCVLAVCFVRRRNLFGPMVQPPLVLIVTVPAATLLLGGKSAGGGLTAKALAVGTPLINSFPVMAAATAITVLIGIARIVLQRNPYRAEERTPERRAEPAAAAPRSARAGQPSPAGGQPPGRANPAASAGRGAPASSVSPPPRRSAGPIRDGGGARAPRQEPPMRGSRPARRSRPTEE